VHFIAAAKERATRTHVSAEKLVGNATVSADQEIPAALTGAEALLYSELYVMFNKCKT
jgi:DNA replication initiation complex subunit (GINS family)